MARSTSVLDFRPSPSTRRQARRVAVPLDALARSQASHAGRPAVVDLFAGAGGFSLGFSLAGAHIRAAIEVDEWATDTLRANHPETHVVRADLRKLDETALADACGSADIIIGGPPCQGYSIANGRAGDPKDPRNSLFKEFIRAARLLRPKALLMENVPGLLTRRMKDGNLVIEVIKKEYQKLGYRPYVRVLQAMDYGVPQIRPRLFVLGLRGSEVREPFPAPTHGGTVGQDMLPSLGLLAPTTVWEGISDLPELEAREGAEVLEYDKRPENELQEVLRAGATKVFNHKAMRHSPRLVQRFSLVQWGESGADAPEEHAARRRGSPEELSGKKYDQNNRRMYPDRPCHTVPASFYANFIHPYKHRNFTPREGARLQTFPDWYQFHGKPTVVSHKLLAREGRDEELHLCQYNQIGNAVPPLLALQLATHLFRLI